MRDMRGYTHFPEGSPLVRKRTLSVRRLVIKDLQRVHDFIEELIDGGDVFAEVVYISAESLAGGVAIEVVDQLRLYRGTIGALGLVGHDVEWGNLYYPLSETKRIYMALHLTNRGGGMAYLQPNAAALFINICESIPRLGTTILAKAVENLRPALGWHWRSGALGA